MSSPLAQSVLNFSIPLPNSLYEKADQESQYYLPNLTKVEQVYRTVLSSYVAQYYLRLNSYVSTTSDSNEFPTVDSLLADQPGLKLPGYGRVATASLLAGQQQFEVPLIAGGEAIACLAIQFDDEIAEATILGFVPSLAPGTRVRLSELEDLAEFPEYLATVNPLASTMTQLKNWWERSFDAGWTLISELTQPGAESELDSLRLSPRSRHASSTIPRPTSGQQSDISPEDGVICRRSIEFSEDDDPLSLLFGIERFPQGSGESQKVSITLNPAMGQGYLPADVQIEAFDESGTCFASACSRATSPFLSIRFRAESNDYFMIQMTYRGITLRDAYIV